MTNTEFARYTRDEMALANAVAAAARVHHNRLIEHTHLQDWTDAAAFRAYRLAQDSVSVVAVAPRRVIASVVPSPNGAFAYLAADALDVDVDEVAIDNGLLAPASAVDAVIEELAPGLYELTW